MARLDELWQETGGPGLPPHLDVKRVKARVNAVLDANHTERKVHMRQKWRIALAAAAALALITGTAFAAATHWDMLTAWFQGDTAPGQAYVDGQARSVSDGNYTLTVEGSAADEQSIYLTLCVTALSDEAREYLLSEQFVSMDTFSVRPLPGSSGSGMDAPASSGPGEAPAVAMPSSGPGEAPEVAMAFSTRELASSDENSRRFALDVATLPASIDTLRVRCGCMVKGKAVDVSIAPAASLTVTINASGEGVMFLTPAETMDSLSLTIREIVLSPFSCTVYGSYSSGDVYPNLRFRMKDGTVLTQAQTLNPIAASLRRPSGECKYNYRFKQVQDLDSITSVIVFDREYPLDGSRSVPVQHDPALDPFTVTRMEPLSETGGYTVPVRELTEKLGGAYTWDAAGQTAACTYRGVTVTLKAGSTTALVDGQEAELSEAPAEQGGILTAGSGVFRDAWGIECCLQRVNDTSVPEDQFELIWLDWYIIP